MSASSRSKRAKQVRESFTLPESELAAIDVLKSRAIAMGTRAKKSELLRAGLMVLLDMNEAAYKRALAAVPRGQSEATLEVLPEHVPKAKRAASAPPAPRPARPTTRDAAPKRQPPTSGVKRPRAARASER